MTNILRNQALTEWNTLKGKIQSSIETAWKDVALPTYSTKEHQEFERERTTFNKLEEKLEKVRNLVSDNKISELKQLIKNGKI